MQILYFIPFVLKQSSKRFLPLLTDTILYRNNERWFYRKLIFKMLDIIQVHTSHFIWRINTNLKAIVC